MFSALQRGSTIYILDKTDGLKYKIGQIDSTTQPVPKGINYNRQYPYNPVNEYVMDIKVNVDGEIKEFKQVLSNLSYASFDNGNYVISETRDNILNEVQAVVDNSENVINSVSYHQKLIKDGKDILKQMNPQYAKEEERDSAIANLRTEFGAFKQEVGDMKSDISKILTALSKPGNS